LACALSAVPAGAHGYPPGPALQALLEAEHAAGMPGLFAEVRDGRHVWRGAAGVADIGTGRPVHPGFRHRVGSITKSFVATTVLQLVGEGRVTLDAPASRYLPSFGIPDGVTVRMLLNHTSGIGNYTDALFPTLDSIEAHRTQTFRPRELAELGLGLPRTGAPGARWTYSNTNYVLAGLLVERVTGHRYAAEVARRILRPLHLRDTYFPGTDPYIRGPHSRAYAVWPDGTLRDLTVYNMSWVWAAGELISTAADLNRFYGALLAGRLLRPGLLTEMQTTVPMDPDAPEAAGYGLGLLWLATPCGRVWGHDGGVIGHGTMSLHRIAAHRQTSLAENMTYYAQPSPIDEARWAFLLAALCGPDTDLHAAGAWARRLPSATGPSVAFGN
jgi:D-alanyl-D-alanine carboxypeptidase